MTARLASDQLLSRTTAVCASINLLASRHASQHETNGFCGLRTYDGLSNGSVADRLEVWPWRM
jgi:hypothetical protein